jgi:hypothetical protein
VLCYLLGNTRDQAARQLGWSLRTLERRLHQGLRLLRARLSKRGIELPMALLTAGLSQQAADVSAATVVATVEAAVAFHFGADPAAGVVSVSVPAANVKDSLVALQTEFCNEALTPFLLMSRSPLVTIGVEFKGHHLPWKQAHSIYEHERLPQRSRA